MRLARFYTDASRDFYAGTRFRTVSSEDWVEYIVPQAWNQPAADVLRCIFYPAALPALTRRVEEQNMPAWLWRSEVDNKGLDSISAEWRYRTERDIRDVLHRIAGALTYQGWKSRIFTAEEDAKVFYDEFSHILLHQIAAPELRQWQLLGLNWAYGLTDALPYMPLHRIVSFRPDTAQALRRIKLLGETLALETAETKISVTLPVENGDSPAFTAWKRNDDFRQVAEQLGQGVLQTAVYHVLDACDRDGFFGFDPARNPALRQAAEDARQAGLSDAGIDMAIRYAEQGYEEISFAAPEEGRSAGSCITTVLSLPDDFIEAALTGHRFLFEDNSACSAEKLWDALAEAVWASGEPAISFRDSAGSASVLGPDKVCDVAGGFAFLPDSMAASATINLLACATGKEAVDTAALQHVTRIMTVALEIVTDLAASSAITREYRPVLLGMTNMAALLMGRGLAYDSEAGRATAALVAGCVSGSAYHASAEIAAEIAASHPELFKSGVSAPGAFPAYPSVAKTYLQTLKDKMVALSGTAFLQKGMTRRPVQIRTSLCPDAGLAGVTQQIWDNAYRLGKETGFRHAHLTGIGTDPAVQALLGAQTQDIMPEAALVRFEGYFSDTPEAAQIYGKKLNPMVPRALAYLGYTAAASDDIHFYAAGHGTLLDAPHVNHQNLRAKSFNQGALDAVEAALTTALHIRYVFNKWTLGEEFCRHILGFSQEDLSSGAFDMLPALGFTEEQIEAANIYCCGTLSLEGAPHLQPAHIGIFDCIAPSGTSGVRRVPPEAQIKMQAALEPFLSGAVAHTVILEHHVTIDEVQKLILSGWELGVKTLRLYRDGCSLLHSQGMMQKPAISENTEKNQSVILKVAKAGA